MTDYSDRVWAIDRAGRRAGPVHRDLISLDPDRYRADDNHPVTDHMGRLLPSKPLTNIDSEEE